MKKKLATALPLALGLAAALAACAAPGFCGFGQERGGNAMQYVRSITSEEAKALIDRLPDAVVIDVREPGEFRRKRVPGALNIPLSGMPGNIAEKGLNLDAAIILYCNTGRRVVPAAQFFLDAGFADITTFPGMESWNYSSESGAP